MKNKIITTIFVFALIITGAQQVEAGTLYPTSAPGETMYSLQEIFDLVTASTTSEIGDGSSLVIPTSTSASMVTLTELYNAIYALLNTTSSTTPDDVVDEEEETPIDYEDGENTEHILVDLDQTINRLITYTTASTQIQFDVFALNGDIYIPQAVALEYINMNDSALTGMPVTTASLTSTADAVDGYYRVSTGTNRSFNLNINMDNTGGEIMEAQVSVSGIEYKIGSVSAPTQVYNTEETEFQGEPIPLRGQNTI